MTQKYHLYSYYIYFHLFFSLDVSLHPSFRSCSFQLAFLLVCNVFNCVLYLGIDDALHISHSIFILISWFRRRSGECCAVGKLLHNLYQTRKCLLSTYTDYKKLSFYVTSGVMMKCSVGFRAVQAMSRCQLVALIGAKEIKGKTEIA